MDVDVDAWRAAWQAASFAPIPLVAGGKRPACSGWQTMPPAWQWQQVSPHNLNIGVLPGDGFLAVDGDTHATCANLGAILDCLQVPYVPETTASGKRHYWLAVDGVPAGLVAPLLASDIGKGECRTRTANVVVSGSVVGDGSYHFENGSGPGAIAALPRVPWSEVHWLVPEAAPVPAESAGVDGLPVRLLFRGIPTRAGTMLGSLQNAPASTAICGFPSASECEASVVAQLALAGWTYAGVHMVFERSHCGSYWRNGNGRGRYLWHTWRRVCGWLAENETRQEIANAFQRVAGWSWPGRGGGLECRCLLALLATCYQCGSWRVFASARDVAEYAACGFRAASNALHRLASAGLVVRVATSGTALFDVSPIRGIGWQSVRDVAGAEYRADVAELWRRDDMGSASWLVYSALGAESATSIAQLVAETGKARSTVFQALHRLAGEGLAESAPGGWVRGPVSLDVTARLHGARFAGEVRHSVHRDERRRFRSRAVR
jgi:hypothetical protein